MQGIIKGAPHGFFRTLAGSFLLHAALIFIAVYYLTPEPRNFLTPVYTVDIITQGPARHKHAPGDAAPNGSSTQALPQRKEPAPAEPAAPAKKEALRVRPEKNKDKAPQPASIEESLRRIEKDVRKKDESALVDSRIEAIRKKKAEESRRLSERIDEMKKEINSREDGADPARKGAKGSSVQPRTAGPSSAYAGRETARNGGGAMNPGGAYPAYYGVIRDKVQEQWIYPDGFRDTNNISVVVSIRLSRTGNLLDSWIEKSSGSASFDESLLAAIKKAGPFPPVPQDFEGKVFETGFRFCPGCPR